MKKLLFAISVAMFSLLGLHTYAADAATTHGLNSNQMRNIDSRNETTPADKDHAKSATKEKKANHKKAAPHNKKTDKSSKPKKHTPRKHTSTKEDKKQEEK